MISGEADKLGKVSGNTSCSELKDEAPDLLVDLIHRAVGVDACHLALLLIQLNDWHALLDEDTEALLDRLQT
jgi:hypothetical protein